MDGGRSNWVADVGDVCVGGCAAAAPIGAGTYAMDATFTRRRLLAAGGAAALVATFGELPAIATAIRGITTPPYLRRSSYVPLIGERFELTTPGRRRVVARLVSVMDLGSGRSMQSSAGGEHAFALLFHSPVRPRLEQDVMSLAHPVLGRFQLLVSPASTGRRGQDYSAAINRAQPRSL